MSTTRYRELAEALLLPLLALAGGLLLFGAFVAAGGHDPVQAWRLLFLGAFGDAFSWQNTLERAAPLMLTALCVALPARAGLTVIGGEGALVLGGLAAAALPYALALPQHSIWWKRSWGATLRSMIDGLIYGCVTAGAFGWLWPR